MVLCTHCGEGHVGEKGPCPFAEAHDNEWADCEANCCAECREFCRQEI